MKNLKEKLNQKRREIIISIALILVTVAGFIIYFGMDSYEDIDAMSVLDEMEKESGIANVEENQIENEVENKIESMSEKNGNQIEKEEIDGKIAIHIIGEVNQPGLVYLNKGARIADAIKAAGGATKNAGLDKINLAYILEDGQKIYIPNKNEEISKNGYIISDSGENVLVEAGKNNKDNTDQNTKGANSKVNINSANQTELETLPGIGPSLAQRIIEYRESNGNFQKIEDLQNVKGIGDSKYSNIKEKVCIE